MPGSLCSRAKCLPSGPSCRGSARTGSDRFIDLAAVGMTGGDLRAGNIFGTHARGGSRHCGFLDGARTIAYSVCVLANSTRLKIKIKTAKCKDKEVIPTCRDSAILIFDF